MTSRNTNDYVGPPRKKFAVELDAANDADAMLTTNTSNVAAAASDSKNSSNNLTSGSTAAAEIASGARRLAHELQDFMSLQQEKMGGNNSTSSQANGGTGTGSSTDYGSLPLSVSSDESIIDLQLATCRKLRELLPNSKELLHVAQERNWIPLMLSWLNLHDRPAVQVESLLALTNIAELCAQQSYFQHTAQQTSAVAAATQAAVSAVKGGAGPSNSSSFQEAMEAANKLNTSKFSYPSLVAPAPGSVPFPPLSFSQTLSPEAVAAFDANLTSTIQSVSAFDAISNPTTAAASSNNSKKSASSSASDSFSKASKNHSWSLPPAPLFPSSSTFPAGFSSTGAINFTSLAPPPGGAHTSVPSNAFLPPPTPVAIPTGGPSFPQQLSASSQHLLLRHADAIPTLISLLTSPNREVYEQAMWILGSIAAGDSPGGATTGGSSTTSSLDGRDKSVSARDVILAAGVMNQLLRCLETHPNNLSLQRIGSWTLSNLVDGIFQQSSHSKTGSTKSSDYSSADEIDMTVMLPVVKRLLNMTDSEVLSYTCWTLSHLCDGPSSHIAAVVTTKDTSKEPPGGLVPRLVELLIHPSWRVTKPALRTIGNIVCAECSDDAHGGSTDYTEVILECEAVPRLKELVTHSNREIQKEACWTLSNIAAGTVDQIEAVIATGAIKPLVQLVQDKKTDQEVRSEACWVVLNATSCGSDSQIEVLVDEGCVSVLGVLLSEASMVMMALEGLERVLQVEETREILHREQIENGDLEDEDETTRTPTLVSAALIEKAREAHNSSAVTKRADRIWKQHFVSCALCRMSFSKHRTSDASFCEECKCHVCSNCNCRVYHLDYQEELWAATEEKTVAKKNAKKSKNKKKKEKLKQKKAKQQQEPEPTVKERSKSINSANTADGKEFSSSYEVTDKVVVVTETSKKKSNDDDGDDDGKTASSDSKKKTAGSNSKQLSPSGSFDDDDEEDESQNQIDFVLYLEQTGSIIALAKLMDALEYGDDYDEELDDYERKMIREQQMMRNRATNSAH